jgi:hypothetical protein
MPKPHLQASAPGDLLRSMRGRDARPEEVGGPSLEGTPARRTRALDSISRLFLACQRTGDKARPEEVGGPSLEGTPARKTGGVRLR